MVVTTRAHVQHEAFSIAIAVRQVCVCSRSTKAFRTFNFERGEIRVNGNIVAGRFDIRGKTNVVPWEYLAVRRARDERFRHVPILVDEIRGFLPGARAV